MNILFQLLIGVVAFLAALWLLSFTGIPSPLNLLIAIVVAFIAAWQSPRLLNHN
jgi:Na+/H+ antiporter NhaC